MKYCMLKEKKKDYEISKKVQNGSLASEGIIK